ncbi:2-hydroxyacid dehydrogenase [Flavobacteriaceae bacterium M23B6Z8]
MRILVYSAYDFIIPYLKAANNGKHDLRFTKRSLTEATVDLAKECNAISIFSADDASATVLRKLHQIGIKGIALRSTGFDCVDMNAARFYDIKVANVPEYSPYAIAEHATALLLGVNRNLILSNDRIRKHDFSIDGLTGFDLNGKTVGIIGTGKIGSAMSKICHGMGCKMLAYDLNENEELQKAIKIRYVSLEDLCRKSDVISLHVPLNKTTYHLINDDLMSKMKKGVLIVNTARGAVIDTKAIFDHLQRGKIGGLGMDVYEFEKPYFFKDCSEKALEDQLLQRLIAMPNVLITAHHAFLTKEALQNIATATIEAFNHWQAGNKAPNELFKTKSQNKITF